MEKRSAALLQIKAEEKVNNDALEKNKSQWQEEYAGKWVAIHQGKVIANAARENALHVKLDQLDSSQKLTGDILLHQFTRIAKSVE